LTGRPPTGSPSTGRPVRRLSLVLALVALIAAALGVVLLAGAGHGLSRRHVVVGGVPMDEVHPAGLAPGRRRPGVVVAHGFAGSAGLPAVFLARILPTARLPIAIGGFVVGYTAVIGALLTAYGIRRPAARGGWRGLPLIGYAVAAIALPMSLGLTHAVPVGPRWWLLPLIWAAFALPASGAERLTGGNALGVLLVSAVVLAGLAGAAIVGLTDGFVLLVVPPLALLFVWQALWSAVLNRFAAPPWLTALTGSIVVAWPIAIALPLLG
jgi:hypothetical protein